MPETEIPFTQYLRPNGRKRVVSIERPAEIVEAAHRLIKAGYRFEVEELSTGHASLTVVDPDDEGDVAIAVVPNGPEVPAAVDRIVAEATKHMDNYEPPDPPGFEGGFADNH